MEDKNKPNSTKGNNSNQGRNNVESEKRSMPIPKPPTKDKTKK